jgi:hypothetical protein
VLRATKSKRRKLNSTSPGGESEASGEEEEESEDDEDDVEAAKRMEMPEGERRYPKRGAATSTPMTTSELGDGVDDSRTGMLSESSIVAPGTKPARTSSTAPETDSMELDGETQETLDGTSQVEIDAARYEMWSPLLFVSSDFGIFFSRFEVFRKRASQVLHSTFQGEDDGVSRERLLEEMNRALPAGTELFSTYEAERFLSRMSDDQDLYFTDGIVYKI